MPYVKAVKKRNVTLIITAEGEHLFLPGSGVLRWKKQLNASVLASTEAAAPVNKRPRWSHYGEPLKSSFFKTGDRVNPIRMFASSAVGSRSHYSVYTDQGTGVHGGNGPYRARILPPWQYGSASLYESTWRPAGQGAKPVAPVMIKGQRGQHYFEKGIIRGARASRLQTYRKNENLRMATTAVYAKSVLPAPSASAAMGSAFRSQLEQWREWRDDAWMKQTGLGRGGGVGSKLHRRTINKEIRRRGREGEARRKAKKTTKTIQEIVAKDLASRGIPASKIRNLKIHNDGTYTYEINIRSVWKFRTGRWGTPKKSNR